MTVEQLQAKYPDATITAGISALHYVKKPLNFAIEWNMHSDKLAIVAQMDAKIAAMMAA